MYHNAILAMQEKEWYDMGEYEVFLEKQETIYKKDFSGAAEVILQEGFTPDPTLEVMKQAFIVLFRLPDQIALQVADLSRRVAEIVPALVYEQSSIHSTIFVYRLSEQVIADDDPDCQLIRAGVNQGLTRVGDHPKKAAIDFTDCLTNKSTGILVGKPNESWFITRQSIIASCREAGLENVRGGWGSHVTFTRYLSDCHAEPTRKVIDLLDHVPVVGLAKMSAVEAARFTIGREGFFLDPFFSYELEFSEYLPPS